MPLRTLPHADSLVYQLSGESNKIPVVYLPGVHGCWTPMDQARTLINKSLRLIEVAYPLIDNWTLQEYGDALLNMLHHLGLESVHLIGESFGSLIAWQLGLMHPKHVRSHTLVGGFSQAPGMYLAASAGLGLSVVPAAAFDRVIDTYVAIKNRQGESRKAAGVKAYPAVRGSKGQKATANRMRLIQQADFIQQLGRIKFPVRYIGGERDRIIPVAREISVLKEHLPKTANFQSHLIKKAPHVIMASHPAESVEFINRWIFHIERDVQ